MKKIISFLLCFSLIFAIVPFSISAAPESEVPTTNSSQAMQNTDPELVVTDYGVEVDPNELKGYSESNGNVENSPFGSIYTDAFGYEEALYMGMSGYFHLEGSSADSVPTFDESNSKNIGSTNMKAVAKGFKIKGTDTWITWDKIIYATAETGDFNADLRDNGTVILFATGGTPDNVYTTNVKIYLAVFDPTDNETSVECVALAELPYGYIQSKYDFAPMLQIVTGNIVNDDLNKQKLSPDEFIVTYPTYDVNSGWYLKAVVYKTLSSDKNNTIADFVYHSDISPDYKAKILDFCVEDINGDSIDDVLAVTSGGVSNLKINKMLGKTSDATVYAWIGGEKEYKLTAQTTIKGMYRAGVVALDINKDGRNEIAVCSIKDILYGSTVTVTDTVTLFSFKNNAFKNIGSAEFDSTISADSLDELNTTLMVNAVTFATKQQTDINSNSITKSDKDSPIMICYDGMLIKYSFSDKKLSLAKNGRESYMKADSVLYEGYSGMVYANAEGDDQEEIFLLYYKGNDRILSMHPDITAQKRVYGSAAVGDTPVGCFALGNTDYDSGQLRYDDWAFTYTDPTAVAIVAAPPTFHDFLHIEENYIVMGNTTYEMTTTSGTSFSEEKAFGGLLNASLGAVKINVKGQETKTYSKSFTTTKTTSFAATQETIVATCVIPVECYYYTIQVASPDGIKQKPYVVPKEYDAVFTTMTIGEYDKLAQKYNKDVLQGNVVIHTDGDPLTYKYPQKGTLQADDAIRTSYNKGITSSKIEVSKEEESQTGLAVSADVMVGYEYFGVGGFAGATIDYNHMAGTLSGTGSGYSGNVRNVPIEGSDNDYGFTWRLKKIDVTVDGKEIPFITYDVTNCSTNPRMPENVTAHGVTSYDENGNLIPANKVIWQETELNKERDVHYEILRSRDGFEGAFETIGTAPYGTGYFVDNQGLEFGKEYEYKVMAVKNDSNAQYASSIEPPAAKAKTLSKNGGVNVTVENKKVTVNSSQNVSLKVNVDGIQDGDIVTYQWERRLYAKGWTSLSNANKSEYEIKTPSLLWDKAIYRCLVKKKITLADGSTEWIYNYSDPIMLIVE